jgi:hypothetical protein
MTSLLAFSIRRRMRRCIAPLLAAMLIFGLAERGQAQEGRFIILNGEQLDAQAIRGMDILNCGVPVPDGIYWIDLQRQEWGEVGMPGSLSLPDCSGANQSRPAQPSAKSACELKYRYHEDRMCYCYGVCGLN